VPVLPDQQHLADLVQRDHSDRARMLNDLAADLPAAGDLNRVPPDRDDLPADQLVGAGHRPALHHISEYSWLR
jgi:hypothetical protein